MKFEPEHPERRGADEAHSKDSTARKYDLEDRLLDFAVGVIDVSEKMPDSRASNHIAGQILRSGTSPYGNHGEAQSPESMDDFIHKMKICLKELRETRRWAKLIWRKRWLGEDGQLAFVLGESEELIRIFKASIQTAERNRAAKHPPATQHPGATPSAGN
ncbi:MAG TPA: four helix bundle protein [Candidatus Sulfotelmatobacter sp.]|nr:four helix bundle protein [Candidatus Sulfotelmatobacter sp.]HWI58542.1 four helix bundle protein [Bacillota bacterium]